MNSSETSAPAKAPKLLDQVRAKLRLLHASIRTEEAYCQWIVRFVKFHGMKHPNTLREREIEAFLSDLAVGRKVSASTQNQALAAILFLYRHILEIDLQRIDALRAKQPERLPVVLSIDEVRLILGGMVGRERLMTELLYGAGLRLLEVCRLRVKDVDFDRRQLMVRDGKGEVDRAVPLPAKCDPALRDQVETVPTSGAKGSGRGIAAGCRSCPRRRRAAPAWGRLPGRPIRSSPGRRTRPAPSPASRRLGAVCLR
jgi:site-specific recombinase XerD